MLKAKPHPATAKDLWEQFLSCGNLAAALRRVERNAGAPGVDGMQTGDLRPWPHDHCPEVRAALEAGTYQTATDQEGHDPKALRRRAGAGGADGPGIE
jgi:RNA-directed DNA polymerase